MNKIKWCKKQGRGIKLQDPNNNLSEEYYENAEESLRVLRNITETKSKMWLATTKYYIEYFAVYSVLMKIGIKCEIHDCTIALVKFFEDEDIIEKGTAKILENDKELRIDNQYYLKNKPVNIDFGKLSDFLISIRRSLDKLDNDKIAKLIKKIKGF
ncbi:hypothetical protein CEE44_04070 [Candidatus Woesearchaeota archaeon B3_Woes]|nr:MAG: hypothetical protein CEE44_04070 [Candidatus Woesearchaeota archaeon B3_Woes]